MLGMLHGLYINNAWEATLCALAIERERLWPWSR